jgi:dodecin
MQTASPAGPNDTPVRRIAPYSGSNTEHPIGGAVAKMVKVIEVLAQSETGWEEATQVALQEAAKTVRNIQSIYIKEMQAVVENDRIVQYRVNAKISFALDR